MRARIVSYKGPIPLLFSFLIIILCLAGCAENSSILDNGQNRQLGFSVSTHGWNNSNKSSDQKVPSRATPISGSTFDTSNSFNVIADVNHGGNWSTEVNNETVSYSTANNIWQTSATHYWPGSGSTVNFYAYYPTSILNKITHTAGSAPVLSYTVPNNATDQIDIITSSKTGMAGDSYNQTPVDFKHIFAAVQFRVGSSGMINGTIVKISLNGILNTGSYSFTSGWTPQTSSTTTYTKNVSAAGDAGTEIVSGNDLFLVMPQALSNASFTVTYSGGATLTKNLSGTWEAGKVYEYNINSSFSATQDFNYTGNVQSYTVPFTGTYKLEVWGAQGGGFIGDSKWGSNGGKGGYSYGQLKLVQGHILYIFVGGQGQVVAKNTDTFKIGGGGYNGGGNGTGDSFASGYGGGGMSHISTNNNSIIDGSWNPDGTLIVAGGGGGSDDTTESNYTNQHNDGELKGGGNDGTGGYGGGSTSGEPYSGGVLASGYAATQTTGYKQGVGESNIRSAYDDAGAGGGWYGGKVLLGDAGCNTGGSGGSGYLSNEVIGETIAGNQSFVSPSGETETGHSGNGYARITFISAN